MALSAPIKRAVIVHGYYAGPDSHWFTWLGAQLAARGIDVQTPALSDPGLPTRDAWVSEVAEAIGTPADDLLLVAHSLGSITTLLALDSLSGEWSLGALSLVSGTLDSIPALPPLDEFMNGPTPDVARTAARTRHVTMLSAEDDPFVPTERSRAMADLLGGTTTTVPAGGHFTDEAGTMELPELWRSIEPLLA